MSTITAAPAGELTPDDVLNLPEGDRYELVDGRLVEMSMGSISHYVGTLLSWMLINHCRPLSLAHVFVEAGYTCFPGKPNQLRKPDVSCIRVDRLPLDKIDDGYFKLRPDLAVEVISPNDVVVELEAKLDDYRSAGIPLIWLIYPMTRRVRVLRPEGPSTEVGPDGVLSGEDVLPGFGCLVADLFPATVG